MELMPFTGAHPLAVMPLVYWRGLRLDPTCLVIGSMSPDFEYFARVKLASTIGHTLHGIALWCIPVTLLSAWLFHRVAKWPALRVLPRPLAARVAVYAERPWLPAPTATAIASVVVSAALGAVTHIVWDSFTHSGSWGPRNIAALREIYTLPGVGPLVLYRILQHTFMIVGLVILGIVIVRALLRVEPVVVTTGGRVIWFACVAGVTAAAYAKMWRHHETDIGSLVVAPICGLLGGALLAGVIAKLTARAG
jgi:hypothetical protein